MELIQQLDEDDKSMIFKMVDKKLTTKKFKDFFNKNVAALENKNPSQLRWVSLFKVADFEQEGVSYL
ncbi:hypothetical protein [Chryseobacterium aquaticum]|uniref:hypothetical protein n=1 Tax=Chryseobacterium aquaticum TaxID=452084 RepID=UPI002FC8A49B